MGYLDIELPGVVKRHDDLLEVDSVLTRVLPVGAELDALGEQ